MKITEKNKIQQKGELGEVEFGSIVEIDKRCYLVCDSWSEFNHIKSGTMVLSNLENGKLTLVDSCREATVVENVNLIVER